MKKIGEHLAPKKKGTMRFGGRGRGQKPRHPNVDRKQLTMGSGQKHKPSALRVAGYVTW